MKLRKTIRRRVVMLARTGGSRYTAFQEKSVRLFLACGHERVQKQSRHFPRVAMCLDCMRAAGLGVYNAEKIY